MTYFRPAKPNVGETLPFDSYRVGHVTKDRRYRGDVAAGYLSKFPPTRIAAVGGKRAWQLEDCEILRDSQRRSKEGRKGREEGGGRSKEGFVNRKIKHEAATVVPRIRTDDLVTDASE